MTTRDVFEEMVTELDDRERVLNERYSPPIWKPIYLGRIYPPAPLRQVNFDEDEQRMIRELARQYGEGCSREHIVKLAVREMWERYCGICDGKEVKDCE